MIVFCEDCGSRYDVDLVNIKDKFQSFNCRECGFMITISKEKPDDIISSDVAIKNRLLEAGCEDDPDRRKRVLIVDDSKLFRRIIKKMIESDGTLEVVGEAADGDEALQKTREVKPDVITLDVNMPGMGGTSVLKHLMLSHPCPVIIVSNLSNRSQNTIIDFLRFGAVDFLVKPTREHKEDEVQHRFIKTIHKAARARIGEFTRLNAPSYSMATQVKPAGHNIPCGQLLLVLSGAGGIAELFNVFTRFPGGFDGTVLVVQEMPEALVLPLVVYINQICRIPVLPASSEVPLLAGYSYIGTPGMVDQLAENEGNFFLINSGMPSAADESGIDALICSVADIFTGKFALTMLSGAACSLEALRYFKGKSGRIIIKQPSTCMVSDDIEKVEQDGLADTEASPTEIVQTVSSHLGLDCTVLSDGGKVRRVASEFIQKRRHQRIYFTMKTGPRLVLSVSGMGVSMPAGVVNLSESGLGFVIMKNEHEDIQIEPGDRLNIASVDENGYDLKMLTEVLIKIQWVMNNDSANFVGYGGSFQDLSADATSHLRQIVDAALQIHQNVVNDFAVSGRFPENLKAGI
ncbi:MAG: hypothetical protein CSB24_04830 [Deltaproteobacteria bacterium]|nr:MAG: hypothetical protein CSB24_04830 [Deltaproteobacteria bacterium]